MKRGSRREPLCVPSIGPLGYLHTWVETGFPGGIDAQLALFHSYVDTIIIRPLISEISDPRCYIPLLLRWAKKHSSPNTYAVGIWGGVGAVLDPFFRVETVGLIVVVEQDVR